MSPSIEGRWKVACINWGHQDAPHALTYHWDGRDMRAERYWPNWVDAVAHLDAALRKGLG